MSADGVAQILYLMDQAFEGGKWHSLLGNLRAVTPEDWEWVPPDGRRSIRDIVQHVAGAKMLYHNHAFGEANLPWDDPILEGAKVIDNIDSAVEWLREGQARLRESVATLDDAELLRPRRRFSGELAEARWLLSVTIEHDLYHAGEINHIRCLHQGDDE